METRFSLIKSLVPGVNPPSKIIRASDYETLYEAARIISAAREEAESILSKAGRSADEAVAKGYQDGIANAQAEIAEMLVSAKIRANHIIQQSESDLVALVKLTIEKILGDIGEDRKIVHLIQVGLGSMINERRVTIRVAPEVIGVINEALPEVTKELPHVEYFDVKADAGLSDDAYIIESDIGSIRCSFSDQLSKINTLIDSVIYKG